MRKRIAEFLLLRINELGGFEVYSTGRECPVCGKEIDFDSVYRVPYGGADLNVPLEQKIYDIASDGEVWVHGTCLETEAGKLLSKALEKLEKVII